MVNSKKYLVKLRMSALHLDRYLPTVLLLN